MLRLAGKCSQALGGLRQRPWLCRHAAGGRPIGVARGLRSSLALWSEWFCTPAPTPSCFLLPLLPPTPCPCPCLGAAGSLGAGTAGEKLAAEASSLREQRHREERRWREGLSPEAPGPATARPAPHFLCPGPLLPKLV